MILDILVAGFISQPKPVLVDIKPIQRTELIQPLEPIKLEKQEELSPIIIKPPVAPVRSSTAPYGWYPKLQCTWYVWSRRPVGLWHDASTWPTMAGAEGWYVGPVPVVGAIGQQGNHVVYIERIEGNQVYISERNYDNNGSYRERLAPISDFTYIY